jgi:hypothetical protein
LRANYVALKRPSPAADQDAVKRAIAILIATGWLVGLLPAAAQADADCGDFATQQEAQGYYEAHGGPAVDPDRLDEDGDGIACETLPSSAGGPSKVPPASDGPAPPAGSGCVNLKVYAGMKAELRAAYKRGHPGQRPASVGPRPGTTYYGRCGQIYYALAGFWRDELGNMDGPEAFRKRGKYWHDINDNGACYIPLDLLAKWNLSRSKSAC